MSDRKRSVDIYRNETDILPVIEQDIKKGLERIEENVTQQKIRKVNKYSFYTLFAIMLYSIARVRYNEFGELPIEESIKIQRAEQSKLSYDTPQFTPKEKQAYWNEIDEFWNQKLWSYRGVELNAVEFDDALKRDFSEYAKLKQLMELSLNTFNDGIYEFYRPIEGILKNSKEMLGSFGEIIARTGILIISIISCIGTYRVISYLPSSSSQMNNKNVDSMGNMLVRTEDETGVKYLNLGEIKDIIESKPIEKSFFDSFYATIFDNPEFNDILEIFGESSDNVSSAVSVSSQNSIDTAKNSINSVDSDGFYGMGELNGMKKICESILNSRIGTMVSENLLSCGAATYAGILKMSEPIIGSCRTSDTDDIPCESKKVLEASEQTALELLQGYNSDDEGYSSDVSELSRGGKKTRKNKKSTSYKKTKRTKRVKKTKNSRKTKKSRKNKKSKK